MYDSLICFKPLVRLLEGLGFVRFTGESEGPQEEIKKGCMLYLLKFGA